MTEIPMTRDSSPVSPDTGGRKVKTIAMVIVVILVIGGAVLGFTLNSGFGATTTTDTTSPVTIPITITNYDYTILAYSEGIDPFLYPIVYSGGFELTTDHIDDTLPPNILFYMYYDTGTDSGDVWTYLGCYDLEVSSFDSMDWSNRDTHDLGNSYVDGAVTEYINLPKVVGDYTWAFYIYDGHITRTSVWSVDIFVILRYNGAI